MATVTPSAAKVLVNEPDHATHEAIDGFLLSNPQLTRLDGFPDIKVVLRADWDAATTTQVALISGGGSGHEPAHAGFCGKGMLTAAVCGDIYASPSVAAISAAIRAVAGAPGVLLIVKNYTGDRLAFGLAAEEARARGVSVEVVFVGDDAALDTGKITGRRGVAGTCFVHKVAGALAAQGKPLSEVAAAAQRTADTVASMGVALSVCSIPGAPRSTRLDGDVIEIGLGIHGEPGASQSALITADAAADLLVDKALTHLSGQDLSTVAVLVNDLGGCSAIEVSIIAGRVYQTLKAKGSTVSRLFNGPFMTALDMHGVSLSVLPVDDATTELLDFPTSAPGWPSYASPPNPAAREPLRAIPAEPADEEGKVSEAVAAEFAAQAGVAKAAVKSACEALLGQVALLTELDTKVGDGDCGLTFERGANRVLAALDGDLDTSTPARLFKTLGKLLRFAMGGTSGVVLDIQCAAAEAHMRTLSVAEQWTPTAWANAFQAAVSAATKYGNAKVGDCTMIDCLAPAAASAVKAALDGNTAAAVAVAAAAAGSEGAEATAAMRAGAGRASYLSDEATEGIRDPGAVAMASVLAATSEALQ